MLKDGISEEFIDEIKTQVVVGKKIEKILHNVGPLMCRNVKQCKGMW